jgi:septal ring factor EnvC (AmiA/AmiB activator)
VIPNSRTEAGSDVLDATPSTPAPRGAASAAFDRLDAVVGELVGRHAALRDENAKLAVELAARDRRIEELEGELRRVNHSRREASRRIDEMIAQIDQLEGRLVARAE